MLENWKPIETKLIIAEKQFSKNILGNNIANRLSERATLYQRFKRR